MVDTGVIYTNFTLASITVRGSLHWFYYLNADPLDANVVSENLLQHPVDPYGILGLETPNTPHGQSKCRVILVVTVTRAEKTSQAILNIC